MECRPAFDYARAPHRVELVEQGARFVSDGLKLFLGSPVPLREGERGGVTAELTLHEGESVAFVLEELPKAGAERYPSARRAEELFRSTVDYWRRWLAQCTYTGRWREMVYRSALVLKLLT
jgi:GH15 family glucan-1,4-alpha-glucosidase